MNFYFILTICCLFVSIVNFIILISISNFLIKFASSINDPEFNIADKEKIVDNKENPNNEKGLIDV